MSCEQLAAITSPSQWALVTRSGVCITIISVRETDAGIINDGWGMTHGGYLSTHVWQWGLCVTLCHKVFVMCVTCVMLVMFVAAMWATNHCSCVLCRESLGHDIPVTGQIVETNTSIMPQYQAITITTTRPWDPGKCRARIILWHDGIL